MRAPRRPLAVTLALGVPCVALFAAWGCNDKAIGRGGAASASGVPSSLSPELASKVLAKVGDREITLGEYAAAIDRMDSFERLRYQSPERRKQLLQEMIRVELLAVEAKARGLDKKPETQERLRQILRDELLRRARADLPTPAEIPEQDVRAWYDAHKDDYHEPERRRAAVIALDDEAKAKKVLELARKATPAEWGKLVREHSLDPARDAAGSPLELAGDLGIVSGPGEKKGENPRVPGAVRESLFKLGKIGDVAAELAREGGRFYVVRLTGRTEARDRSYAEAERTIRVSLVQDRLDAAEKKLEAELRQRYPVKVDDAALARVTLVAPSSDAPTAPAPSSSH